MSVEIARCAFLVIILVYTCIDCISSSTSQQEFSTSLSIDDQQSSDTVTNSFRSPVDNTSTPLWFFDAFKDIAYYLRAYKFNEYDRRYETDAKHAPREYYKAFPRPPLRSLHWEVHKYCEEDLFECVNYLRKRVRNSGLKRIDDPSVVIQEQQWDMNNNSQQIEIVNQECKKMKDIDDVQANPFEGPLERYQWRVTATYYLCWYTMKSHQALKHLSENCDNFANCLDPDFGPKNKDHRANDKIDFSCALYSFCPDPCCPVKHLTSPENCWNMPDNPCFEDNPAGQRECVVKRSENTEFRDIILNRWNVTCHCPKKGFEWSSFYGICIDINECAQGTHSCDPENEMCLNLPGSFRCICKWGHTFDPKSSKCKASAALVHLVLERDESKNEEQVTESLWDKFLRFVGEKSSSRKSYAQFDLIAAELFFVFVYKLFLDEIRLEILLQ